MLWNKYDIYLVSKLILLESGKRGEKWLEIENNVLEKVEQLSRAEYLKEKISNLVRPIGLEILRWIEYHKDLFTASIAELNKTLLGIEEIEKELIIPDKLFWTPQGTVNFKKTAEMLIKDENLDIKKRYILACDCCLEKEIFELWNRMSEQYKQHFCIKDCSNVRLFLIVHWTCTINCWKNEMIRDTDFTYKYLFGNAVKFANLEAAQFFYPKLPGSDHNNTLEEAACCESASQFSSDMWCFIISQMEDTNTELFYYGCNIILYSFLKWPGQSLFMEIAELTTITEEFICDYYGVLCEIASVVRQGYKDYNYQGLFVEFWQFILEEHKSYIIQEIIDNPTLLLSLLKIKDMETFYLILKEASAKECTEIFFNNNTKQLPFLKLICLSSLSTDFVEFVKDFKVRILSFRSEEEIQKEKEAWGSLFDSMDNYVLVRKKRLLSQKIMSCIKL